MKKGNYSENLYFQEFAAAGNRQQQEHQGNRYARVHSLQVGIWAKGNVVALETCYIGGRKGAVFLLPNVRII